MIRVFRFFANLFNKTPRRKNAAEFSERMDGMKFPRIPNPMQKTFWKYIARFAQTIRTFRFFANLFNKTPRRKNAAEFSERMDGMKFPRIPNPMQKTFWKYIARFAKTIRTFRFFANLFNKTPRRKNAAEFSERMGGMKFPRIPNPMQKTFWKYIARFAKTIRTFRFFAIAANLFNKMPRRKNAAEFSERMGGMKFPRIPNLMQKTFWKYIARFAKTIRDFRFFAIAANSFYKTARR